MRTKTEQKTFDYERTPNIDKTAGRYPNDPIPGVQIKPKSERTYVPPIRMFDARYQGTGAWR